MSTDMGNLAMEGLALREEEEDIEMRSSDC